MENVKIALLGFGTVGTGVWNVINGNGTEIEQKTGVMLEIAKVLVRDKHKQRSINLPEDIITTDFEDILADSEIKIVVEVIGGLEPARKYIERALEAGRHVVTANKLLVSKHGDKLIALAASKGAVINYEASVCGGIPIISTIRESLNGDRIEEIAGIVNGTTNYILSKMSNTSCSFKEALREAQEKGYAEADPTSDVEGYDALYKLRILTKLAYGADVGEQGIYREGISRITAEDIDYAKELGYEIKLLAVSKSIGSALDVRVHPAMIPIENSLARISEAYNAVRVKGNAAGDLLFCGRGAGELPTGSAVVNDVLSIVRNKLSAGKTAEHPYNDKNKKPIDIKYLKFPYYMRFAVKNKNGALQKIINILSDNDIRIASVIKREQRSKTGTVVLMSYEAVEYNMRNALNLIEGLTDAIQLGNLIRVENFGEGTVISRDTYEQSRLYC